MQRQLPYKNFEYLDQYQRPTHFNHIVRQLSDLNIDFFVEKSVYEQKGFLVTCTLGYNFQDSLENTIDLSCFPKYQRVSMDQLTRDQIWSFNNESRNIEKDPAKLISSYENENLVTDFIDNIIYLLINHSCSILSVESVIVYEHSSFMLEYMNYLQSARSLATSNLEGRLIKNLSNSVPGMLYAILSVWSSLLSIYIFSCCDKNPFFFLPLFLLFFFFYSFFFFFFLFFFPGKLHQKIDSYNHVEIAMNKEKFLKSVSDPNFMDFKVISSNCSLLIKDGICVNNKTLPSIPSQVYRSERA